MREEKNTVFLSFVSIKMQSAHSKSASVYIFTDWISLSQFEKLNLNKFVISLATFHAKWFSQKCTEYFVMNVNQTANQRDVVKLRRSCSNDGSPATEILKAIIVTSLSSCVHDSTTSITYASHIASDLRADTYLLTSYKCTHRASNTLPTAPWCVLTTRLLFGLFSFPCVCTIRIAVDTLAAHKPTNDADATQRTGGTDEIANERLLETAKNGSRSAHEQATHWILFMKSHNERMEIAWFGNENHKMWFRMWICEGSRSFCAPVTVGLLTWWNFYCTFNANIKIWSAAFLFSYIFRVALSDGL